VQATQCQLKVLPVLGQEVDLFPELLDLILRLSEALLCLYGYIVPPFLCTLNRLQLILKRDSPLDNKLLLLLQLPQLMPLLVDILSKIYDLRAQQPCQVLLRVLPQLILNHKEALFMRLKSFLYTKRILHGFNQFREDPLKLLTGQRILQPLNELDGRIILQLDSLQPAL
jgi:hypothetical protein